MASNPMYQFNVYRIGPEIKISEVDLSFTNASLFMVISSLAVLISPTTAIGTEFRTQTNRLGGLAEEDIVVDAFIAYFPNKSISITAAYVDLGNLPLQESSSGFYLTVNSTF